MSETDTIIIDTDAVVNAISKALKIGDNNIADTNNVTTTTTTTTTITTAATTATSTNKENQNSLFLVYTSTEAKAHIERLMLSKFNAMFVSSSSIEHTKDRTNAKRIISMIRSTHTSKQQQKNSGIDSNGSGGSGSNNSSGGGNGSSGGSKSKNSYLIVFGVMQVGERIPLEDYEEFIYECAVKRENLLILIPEWKPSLPAPPPLLEDFKCIPNFLERKYLHSFVCYVGLSLTKADRIIVYDKEINHAQRKKIKELIYLPSEDYWVHSDGDIEELTVRTVPRISSPSSGPPTLTLTPTLTRNHASNNDPNNRNSNNNVNSNNNLQQSHSNNSLPPNTPLLNKTTQTDPRNSYRTNSNGNSNDNSNNNNGESMIQISLPKNAMFVLLLFTLVIIACIVFTCLILIYPAEHPDDS